MYSISYDPLWKVLIDRQMKKNDLQKLTGLSSATIAKLSKGESVTLDVIGKICEKLEVPVHDVVLITTQSE